MAKQTISALVAQWAAKEAKAVSKRTGTEIPPRISAAAPEHIKPGYHSRVFLYNYAVSLCAPLWGVFPYPGTNTLGSQKKPLCVALVAS